MVLGDPCERVIQPQRGQNPQVENPCLKQVRKIVNFISITIQYLPMLNLKPNSQLFLREMFSDLFSQKSATLNLILHSCQCS